MDELWMDRMNAEHDANCQYLHKGGKGFLKCLPYLTYRLISSPIYHVYKLV